MMNRRLWRLVNPNQRGSRCLLGGGFEGATGFTTAGRDGWAALLT
jgi:hypothetical protein